MRREQIAIDAIAAVIAMLHGSQRT